MALNFPNASRAYDCRKQCVSFWGHDAAFEVSFEVEEEALHAISPTTQRTETSLLSAFDSNREQIEHVAEKLYARRKKSYFRLSAADF